MPDLSSRVTHRSGGERHPLNAVYRRSRFATDATFTTSRANRSGWRTRRACGRLLVLVGLLLGSCNSLVADERPPNVLLIVVDDLNDWIGLLDEHSPIATPNLERLAARGTLFTRAYCASPACNPSRTALLTGLRPTTSGVYGNRTDWRQALPQRPTLMQQFRTAGYRVSGAGKIFHHHLDGAFHDAASFDDFQPMRAQLYPPGKLNEAPHYGSRNTDWGPWPPDEQDAIDTHTTNYCTQALRKKLQPQQPWFLACGIFKPHSPFFAPAQYHASLSGALPLRQEDDWDDLPTGAAALLRSKRWFWEGMQELEGARAGSYLSFVEAYAACVRFADAQIGRVLDALDASGQAANTIVVLCSDHGFHLGEKDHIEKFALWEKSNHIPLILVVPGVTAGGSRCQRPVDLTCIYPTLLELCGLPHDADCDGHSLVPLLRDPQHAWEQPAIMTYLPGNHAVRTERWRLIQYADGSQELYDHARDPHEWSNRAAQEPAVLARLRKWLPKQEAPPVGDLQR